MEKIDFTRRLAAFITETEYETLPKEVLDAAKTMILDTLACGIAGYVLSKGEVSPVFKTIEDLGGNRECSLLVSGQKTSWFNAILCNGTLMHSIDYDDTRPGPLTHTGAVIVPTILALGEKLGTSGKGLLLAAVLGYETVFRIGSSVMPSHYQYWHSTGTNGTFGAAAAAGKLLGLNAEEMEMAIGIAADQASGLISCIEFGDLTKSLHAGLTSAKGVLAAMLVKNGATGPRGILEYPRGYCNAFSKEPRLDKFADLKSSFDITNNCPKFFPSVLGSHCAIAATLKLVRENTISADEVVKVNEKTYKTAATTFVNYSPETPLAARLSIPFCIAAAILDKELGMKQFDVQRLQNPRVKELMGKISIEEDPELDKLYPEMFPARIEILTKSGRVFSATEYYPKGFPKNKISAEEMDRKFESLCTHVLSKTRINALKERIRNLEDLDNIHELVGLMASD
jgi:2-methylcitrate dehydratase PrpD